MIPADINSYVYNKLIVRGGGGSMAVVGSNSFNIFVSPDSF